MKGYLLEMAESGYSSTNIPAFHRVVYPYLARKFSVKKSARILELGIGQGHCVIPLLKSGWTNIVAVDVDDTNFGMFDADFGIKCTKLNLNTESIPVQDGMFDYIQSSHVIEHLESPHNFLSEIYRLLCPGGRVVLVTPDWRKWWREFYADPTHIRPFDKEGMLRLFRMYGFKNIEITSFGSRCGFSRSEAILSAVPKLCFIGKALMVTGIK